MEDLYLSVAGKLPMAVRRRPLEEMTIPLDADSHARIYVDDAEPGVLNSGQAMLEVVSRLTVPSDWIDMLADIAEGRFPEGYDQTNPEVSLSIFTFYPDGMLDGLRERISQMTRQASETFNLIRWRWSTGMEDGSRFNTTGPHSWRARDREWTRPLWMPLQLSARLLPQLALTEGVQSGLRLLADADAIEPAGREIWHVAAKADSLTSIVLAVTAVEVEVKRLIAEWVPDSEWLLSNLPAPPIVKLIWKYLPTLPGFAPQYAPPTPLRSRLERGVTLRNSSVHTGPPESASGWLSPDIQRTEVESILACTSDLLWLFDVQRGHEWALDNLSHATGSALGLTDGPPPDPNSRTFVVPRDQGT